MPPEAHADDAPLPRELLLPLLLGELGQARLEDAHRGLLVRGLGALVLALDDDACRQVRDADRGVGLVHVLAARALRAIGVDSQIALVDLDVASSCASSGAGITWANDV